MKKIFVLLLISITYYCGRAQDGVTVRFSVDASMLKNLNNFGIRGSVGPLSWEKTWPLQDADKDGIFEGEITFQNKSNDFLEYKYVYGDKNITWELEGKNRILLLNDMQVQVVDTWNIQHEFDVRQLPELSAEKLTEDFTILKEALLTIHPGLYRYNTELEMDSIFRHFQKVFSQSSSYQDAFLNFTRLTSAIQCGHTFPSFYNQCGFIKEVVLNQKDKLPFTFRVIGGKMIITECVAGSIDLPRGTEVLAINGIAAGTFLSETASLVKADGANDAKRYADLNTFGVGDYFEMFDCYFPLLYPPDNHQYSIKIRKPGNENAEEMSLRTVSRAERGNALIQKYPDRLSKADQLWKLEFWENSTAYLQLGTFDVFQLSFEWSKFLKDAFREIEKRKIRHLVIDIRWNEGGQDEVLLFLGQSIAKKPIRIPQRQDLVRYEKVPDPLRPYLFTWDDTFFDLSQKTKPYNSDYFLLEGENAAEIKPLSSAFGGDIYLLVNASNSSATFYFAEIAKENKLATIIGETTGGSQKGLNAGTMFFLRLPNSQVEIDIPIIGTFSNDSPPLGIEPDIFVSQTLDDITKGEDQVLKTAQLIIQKSQ